jgi:glycosyltransferase involved in cell wall biosynthesis
MNDRPNQENKSGPTLSPLDRSQWFQPLCTIIIPHRDYSGLVGDCLLSILDQTYPNWECIVIDDNSADDDRDRLLKIIKSISHPRIRHLQNRHQLGQVGAFFAGLAEASGEFVSPLDPDDRLHPTYLGRDGESAPKRNSLCSHCEL